MVKVCEGESVYWGRWVAGGLFGWKPAWIGSGYQRGGSERAEEAEGAKKRGRSKEGRLTQREQSEDGGTQRRDEMRRGRRFFICTREP